MRARPSQSVTFHAAMARLALAAMLLLATLPTLGRVASHDAAGAPSGWAAMCTTAGLKYLPLLPAERGQAPLPQRHGDADCDYCPLLASLVLALLWLAFALSSPTRGVSARIPPATPRARVHPCGLGSRGPPIVL